MKQTVSIVIFFIAVAVLGWIIYAYLPIETNETDHNENQGQNSTQTHELNKKKPIVEVVETGLEIPWDIAFLPDQTMLVTERPGRLVHIESGKVTEVDGVEHTGEGGLLGIALHPDFEDNRYVYLYQTQRTEDGSLKNTVVRYTYHNNTLNFDRVVLDDIEGAAYHDGGRIDFGPDGYLWVTTGDATVEENAQNPSTLAGGVLRVNDDGSTPEDNPFGNAVWSYGHRNPQGLAWDPDGRLWISEHGRSGLLSGMDEINLIARGGNYGWPDIEGDEEKEGMVSPKAHSGSDVTWAPASAVYFDGSIFFGGLRGEAVFEAVLNGQEVESIKEHFKGEFGRIRTIRIGPDPESDSQVFYITTSNRDGRGDPEESDDRIIRIDPQMFR